MRDIRSESSELLKKEISENRIIAYIQGDAENIPKQHQKLMDAALERFAARVEGLLKENGHDTRLVGVMRRYRIILYLPEGAEWVRDCVGVWGGLLVAPCCILDNILVFGS